MLNIARVSIFHDAVYCEGCSLMTGQISSIGKKKLKSVIRGTSLATSE